MKKFQDACRHTLPILLYLENTGHTITTERLGRLLLFHVDRHVPLRQLEHLMKGLNASYDFLVPDACDGLSCLPHQQSIRWPSGEPPAMVCEHLLPILNCLLEHGNRVDSVRDDEGLRTWRMWWCVDTTRLREMLPVDSSLQACDYPGEPVSRYLPEQGFICSEHRHKIVWYRWEPPMLKDNRP